MRFKLVGRISVPVRDDDLIVVVKDRTPPVRLLDVTVMPQLDNSGQHQITGPGRTAPETSERIASGVARRVVKAAFAVATRAGSNGLTQILRSLLMTCTLRDVIWAGKPNHYLFILN